MYYNKRTMFISIMWIIVGAALLILDIVGIVDNPICSGIGGGWLANGIMQIYKNLKYALDESMSHALLTELERLIIIRYCTRFVI